VKIERLTAARESAWDAYADMHPEATVFHRAAWKRVMEESLGHAGTYLLALDDGRIVGILPFCVVSTRLFGTLGVSLPFVGYGGAVSDGEEAEKALLEAAAREAEQAGCPGIELRQRFPLKTMPPEIDRKVATVLSTEGGPAAVFARLHQNVRNKIRKAAKEGVSVQEGPDGLPDFYAIYSRNLRDLGTPVITRRFFEAALRHLPDNLRIYRAVRNGRTIAAKIVVADRRTCCFTWSASLRKELKHAPVHAMNWRAIEDACETGCDRVDLGRSTVGSSHQDFKKYWGGAAEALPWAVLAVRDGSAPQLNKENPSFSLAIALWKRLPLGISRILGPPIARGLP